MMAEFLVFLNSSDNAARGLGGTSTNMVDKWSFRAGGKGKSSI